jgi:hypothetical protein
MFRYEVRYWIVIFEQSATSLCVMQRETASVGLDWRNTVMDQEVWAQASATCPDCGTSFTIGQMMQPGASEEVSGTCSQRVCSGEAAVKLVAS